MPKVNYVKAAAKDYPERSIKKGQPYWWAARFRGPKVMWDHQPDRREVLSAVGGSRADRFELWQMDVSAAKANAESLVEELNGWLATVSDHHDYEPELGGGAVVAASAGSPCASCGMPAEEHGALEPLSLVKEDGSPAFELGLDHSELESLAEEMRSWEENMSGSGLESTPKYDEVSSCADELDDLVSTAQGADPPEVPTKVSTVEEAENLASSVEDFGNELEELESASVDFPGMY